MLIRKLIIIASSFFLIGCGQKPSPIIVVGTISGAETILMETAAQVAKKRYNLNVKILSFSNYNLPNVALNAGDIDINLFQHVLYLKDQIRQKKYHFTILGKGFIYPMGIYSKKVTSIKKISERDTVAIPNDPTNETRALVLLEQAGLIHLNRHKGRDANLSDIIANPKHLKFIEFDPVQLPRELEDGNLAVLNNTFASAAGILERALFKERANSVYVNVFVARKQDRNNPQLKRLIQAFHSRTVVNKARELFGSSAVPAFTPALD